MMLFKVTFNDNEFAWVMAPDLSSAAKAAHAVYKTCRHNEDQTLVRTIDVIAVESSGSIRNRLIVAPEVREQEAA